MSIREVIARAICRVQLNGGDPDQPAVRWNGTEIEPQSFPAWRDYMDEAEHSLSALDAAGMTIIERNVIEFLNGSGQIDGWNWGERPAARPNYWWRQYLTDALKLRAMIAVEEG